MPDFEAQLEIPPVSTGIGEARRFTRDQLKSWGLTTLADNAILMISELVTNAILHGGEGAVLTLMADDLKIRAEVRDSNPAMPVVRNYSDTATTGRGMVIVDALAAAWGTFPVTGGKVVWFELPTGANGDESLTQHERPAHRTQPPRKASEYRQVPTGSYDGDSETRPINRMALSAGSK